MNNLENIKNMTSQQQYIYWQQQTEQLRKQHNTLRRCTLTKSHTIALLEEPPTPEKCKMFDCVQMKRKAVQQILEKINNMTTIEEEFAYWQQSTDKLRLSQQAFRRPKNLK